MKRISSLLVAVIMLVSLLTVSSAAAASDDITLRLAVAKEAYKAGDTVKVSLSVDGIDKDAEHIAAMNAQISYDASAFTIETAADKTLAAGAYEKGAVVKNAADLALANPSAGLVTMYFVDNTVSENNISGNGTIVTLLFKAQKDGAFKFELSLGDTGVVTNKDNVDIAAGVGEALTVQVGKDDATTTTANTPGDDTTTTTTNNTPNPTDNNDPDNNGSTNSGNNGGNNGGSNSGNGSAGSDNPYTGVAVPVGIAVLAGVAATVVFTVKKRK